MAPKHFAPVWQHYERHEPTGKSKHHRAICKFCKYELSGQPERMKTHLQRCASCPTEIKDEFANSLDEPSNNTSSMFIGATSLPSHTPSTQPQQHMAIAVGGGGGSEPVSAIMDHHRFLTGEGEETPSPAVLSRLVMAHTAAMAASSSGQDNSNMLSGEPPLKRRRSIDIATNGIMDSFIAATATQNNTHSSNAHPSSTTSPFAAVYDSVRGYYSRVVSGPGKVQTTIGPTVAPHPIVREAIAGVPQAVRDRFYGCGMPLPAGIEGLRVLDLGCGSGRDCYVAARLVGPSGEVIGLDMTDEQLRVARECVGDYARTLGYQPHLRFVKGYIEFLNRVPELYSGSIDLCISNNAVNLSPNKELVLRSVFEVLKEGGEFQFSDIYADRRLPTHVRSHPVLMGECLGGALYTEDFKRLCQRVGFVDARQVSPPAPVRIESPELRDLVGATQFFSITFRLFKFSRPSAALEPTREDYGQVAVYRGTIEGQRARTRFDCDWAFEANRPVLVDGNTAVMLGESWMRRHFEVRGDRSQHFGAFNSTPRQNASMDEPWESDFDYNDLTGTGMRRGVIPLPTPYFINGLQKQADNNDNNTAASVSSRPSSPPPPPPAAAASSSLPNTARQPYSPPRSTSALRNQTTFPRLSSFSISQSNVRSDGPLSSPVAAHTASASPNPTATTVSDIRSTQFVVPMSRVTSTYKPTAMTIGAPPHLTSRLPHNNNQQQQSSVNKITPVGRFIPSMPTPPTTATATTVGASSLG